MNLKITFAVSTYNRLDTLKDFQLSLSLVNGLDRCNVRIYDDCSTEFNEAFLEKLFPYAAEINVRSKNVGSSMTYYLMFKEFLKTKDDVIFFADSDLVFDPNCLKFIQDNFLYTDGFLSVYNSAMHKSFREITIMGNEYIEKEMIGSAGTAIGRDLVKDIVTTLPHRIGLSYDWLYSDYLYNVKKIRMLVSKRSYVQHIGFYGSNCNGLNILDYGLNFESNNIINSNIVLKYLEKFAFTLINTEKDDAYNKMIESIYGSITYKVGHAVLLPAKKLRNFLNSFR